MNEAVAESEKKYVEQTFSLLWQKRQIFNFYMMKFDELVLDPKPKQKFKMRFYFKILETSVQILQKRIKGIDKFNDLFGVQDNFLNAESDVIEQSCIDLDLALLIQNKINLM